MEQTNWSAADLCPKRSYIEISSVLNIHIHKRLDKQVRTRFWFQNDFKFRNCSVRIGEPTLNVLSGWYTAYSILWYRLIILFNNTKLHFRIKIPRRTSATSLSESLAQFNYNTGTRFDLWNKWTSLAQSPTVIRAPIYRY